MRTSLDIPDDLFREIKIESAKTGTTLRDLLLESARMNLSRKKADQSLRSLFGAMKDHPEAMKEFDRAIEEEFGQIDPEDWK